MLSNAIKYRFFVRYTGACGQRVMDFEFDKDVQTSSHETESGMIKNMQYDKKAEKTQKEHTPGYDTASDMKNIDPAVICIGQCRGSSFQKDNSTKLSKSNPVSLPIQDSQRVYERKSMPVSPKQAKQFLLPCTQRQHQTYSTAVNLSHQWTNNGQLKRNREHYESSKERRPSKHFSKSIRQWEWTEFGKSQMFARKHKQEGLEFNVMSYNVLAQNLLEDNSYLYDWSQKKFLDWNNRKHRLVNEIKDLGCPDVSFYLFLVVMYLLY